MDDKHGDFWMRSTLSHIDEPHDAPIAPDIVPADWADCVPRPANDATSREKLFAEIRQAAATAAPSVDNTFRASDVSDNPLLKGKVRSRAWIKRAATIFMFALFSAFAAAAWQHNGDAAKQMLASWVPSPAASSSPAAEPADEPAAQPAAEQQPAAEPTTAAAAAPVPAETTTSAVALPPETEQQIQSMARDLAAMGEQIEQLKATIETLKANQQAAVAPATPVVHPPVPPARPKVTAAPPRRAPAPPPPAQAAAIQPPPPAPPPPQATRQPNGEPIVRPPMPLPLSDRY